MQVLGCIWLILAGLLILVVIIGVWIKEGGLFGASRSLGSI